MRINASELADEQRDERTSCGKNNNANKLADGTTRAKELAEQRERLAKQSERICG